MTCRGLLLLILLTFSIGVYAKDTIAWQTYHRPPGVFNIGENKGQGFIQKAIKLIIEEMPEYNHEFPTTTLARAISDIKAGEHACHPALFVTEGRKKHIAFSDASMFNPTNKIIAKPKTIAPYLENGRVNLVKLLQRDDLTLAHIKNRSYGLAIDNILREHINEARLFQVQSTDSSRVFNLIERERLEFTIAYPFEIEHYLKQQPTSTNQLAVYQIANTPAYNLGAVGCPNTPWGREVIKKVNIVLKKIKATQAYEDALSSWRTHEQKSPIFRQFYNQIFLKN